mmetsp:Transcript_36904/g.59157  ORF Transcript_36904/g.59157 Transcript_36904/m.59157 type:complete len:182 (-) Transcript_36904:211-756(-)
MTPQVILINKGDKWKVVDSSCKWKRASVTGYELFQEPKLFYPFCSTTEKKEAKVFGTLLTWPEDHLFAKKLQMCNRIEGYEPGRKHGLYKRAVVEATVVAEDGNQSQSSRPTEENPETIMAYIYFQEKSQEQKEKCTAFPNGDWLQSKDSNEDVHRPSSAVDSKSSKEYDKNTETTIDPKK